jgi:hypothetical protein
MSQADEKTSVGEPPSGARRQLVAAVVGCVVAASAALFAGTRTWLIETTARPAPQPELVSHVAGGSLVPLLPALGLVALAGAGGLVATRGWCCRYRGGARRRLRQPWLLRLLPLANRSVHRTVWFWLTAVGDRAGERRVLIAIWGHRWRTRRDYGGADPNPYAETRGP